MQKVSYNLNDVIHVYSKREYIGYVIGFRMDPNFLNIKYSDKDDSNTEHKSYCTKLNLSVEEILDKPLKQIKDEYAEEFI